MKVLYLDSALRDDLGHHAPSCRTITKAFRDRGYETQVFGLRDMVQPLREELGATPIFRIRTYDQVDLDPFCGHLVSFEAVWHTMLEDLRALPAVTRDDIVYFSSVQPAQFMAAARWYLSIPVESRPVVAIEFGTDAGVDSKTAPEGNRLHVALRNFWSDPQPLFYRYAGRQLKSDPRFILSTFDPASSSVYGQLTGHTVWSLPVPRFADIAPVSRAGRRPITVSFLGHQRWDKGYQLVPTIARMLLADCPDIKLLIHNGHPAGLPEIQDAVRLLAVDPRVTISEEVAGPDLWAEFLNQSDLIVSPYIPERFSASYSAVTCEAVAHGIPLVVPADTSLSRLLDDFGGPGVTFDRHDPSSIVAAIKRALRRFDALARLAVNAAGQWKEVMGADKTVDMILQIINGELRP